MVCSRDLLRIPVRLLQRRSTSSVLRSSFSRGDVNVTAYMHWCYVDTVDRYLLHRGQGRSWFLSLGVQISGGLGDRSPQQGAGSDSERR